MSKCGPLFDKVLNGVGEEHSTYFYRGFIAGHAEKLWLGACAASMFRPPPEKMTMAEDVVHDVAKIYGLHWRTLRTHEGTEIWLYKDAWVHDALQRMSEIPENSTGWHWMRGHLCGIPSAQIDHEFHRRK